MNEVTEICKEPGIGMQKIFILQEKFKKKDKNSKPNKKHALGSGFKVFIKKPSFFS